MENYFSENLKLLRKQSGLSLEALATKVGCGKSVLSQYEAGKSEPTLSILLNISRYFGIGVSNLTDKLLTNENHGLVVNEPVIDYKKVDLESVDLTKYDSRQLIRIVNDLMVENKALKQAFESLGKGLKRKKDKD